MTAADRATSFGAVADAYDRNRPGYPPELLDELLRPGVVDVVDVGCGTGKLSTLLAAHAGVRVVGVEPDARMAAVARERHGLDVEVAGFEDWDAGDRTFDLATAATSWHWVDQDRGAAKAASILRPGGRLAVTWNLISHEPDARAALDVAYDDAAPELANCVVLGPRIEAHRLAGVDETGEFGPQERHTWRWPVVYSTREWLELLPTHSDHAALPPDRRAALLDAVGAAIERLGGALTVTYETLLIAAARR